MTYHETVDYLYHSAPLFQQKGAAAYKPGLQTTEALDAYFGHPHRNYPTLHVAGTNGKGSTCHTLAAILQAAGLRVGLYTSPHLVDFRERIRVNGKMIPQEYVVRFVQKHRAFFEPLHPSFFELTTAMALRYFADVKVDVAVIEVGLGGRLDCTNIITPLLSIVTNISLDHTALLGATLEAIASEKAGIIKPGIPALVGETTPQTRPVFEHAAQKAGTTLTFAEDDKEILNATLDAEGAYLRYETRSFGTLEGQLTGLCQPLNANTVLHAVRLLRKTSLGKTISDENVREGFRNVCDATGLCGRWQTLAKHPLIVADTGHNTGGWAYLQQQLHTLSDKPETRLFCVLGFAADKDVERILPFLPENASYFWAQASVDRAMPCEQLAEKAHSHGLRGDAYNSVASALDEARRKATPFDTIFVGGSTFVVADAMAHLEEA